MSPDPSRTLVSAYGAGLGRCRRSPKLVSLRSGRAGRGLSWQGGGRGVRLYSQPTTQGPRYPLGGWLGGLRPKTRALASRNGRVRVFPAGGGVGVVSDSGGFEGLGRTSAQTAARRRAAGTLWMAATSGVAAGGTVVHTYPA